MHQAVIARVQADPDADAEGWTAPALSPGGAAHWSERQSLGQQRQAAHWTARQSYGKPRQAAHWTARQRLGQQRQAAHWTARQK